MPKFIHYRNQCIGCGICHQLQPAYWRMSRKDGKATLVQGVIKKATVVRVIEEGDLWVSRQVMRDCPVRIIKIV